MSYPVYGNAVNGLLMREPQSCLGPKWANSYYLFSVSGGNTLTNVYKNGTLTTPFPTTGTVTADAYGRFPAIYLDPSVTYRVRFFNSSGVQQWQVDPYISQLSTVGTSALSAYGINIANTGEVTIPAPNTGGSGVSLTLKAGVLGSACLQVTGTLAGNSAIIVNNSATTGAQTATFTATNKPGTATSSPAGWLPITCDGVQYYTPIWHGNNYTPYAPNPTAQGEVINASSVTFGGNGLNSVGSGSATPGNWFSPITPSIGAGYYINITKTSGTVNFSAAQGSWTNITSGGLTISPSASGTVSGTYQLSTSVSGSPIVASGTIALSTFSVLHVYTSGSGTETIPAGANTVRCEVWGSGGGGGASGGMLHYAGGIGGCGGFAYSSYSASALGGAGKTFTYSVPAGGAANSGAGNAGTITAGTATGFTTMTGNGGGGGGAGSNSGVGAPGTGGTAAGGNVTNTTGATGSVTGTTGSISGDGSPYGGGGIEGTGGFSGYAGNPGAVVFFYS